MTVIDLSQLPAPSVVEPLSHATILAEVLAYLEAQLPDVFVGLLPSDPAYKVAEALAYRELLLRARTNEAAKQCMLAYATGENLDHLAALVGVERLLVDAGNPSAIPPVPPTYETDEALRLRVQLAPEGYTNAGSVGAYRYHALSASGQVKDVGVSTPVAGTVQVVVLGQAGNGVPTTPLLNTVSTALNAETVRPLCDTLQVVGCTALNYTVSATLSLGTGPDPTTVLAAAQAAVAAYVAAQHRVGETVALSGLFSALHQAGVDNVVLASPTANVVATATQAPYCTAISVSQGV
jgi:phage-related baseplate assembly protein